MIYAKKIIPGLNSFYSGHFQNTQNIKTFFGCAWGEGDDLIGTVGMFSPPTFFMLSTRGRYHDACVGDVQYPQIYHDIPSRY